jgi:hypothetical protein
MILRRVHPHDFAADDRATRMLQLSDGRDI